MQEFTVDRFIVPVPACEEILAGLLKEGARKMPAQAIEAEVEDWIEGHKHHHDEQGRLTCEKPRVTVHGGLSRFSRRKRYNAVKMLNCRENGTVPLVPREGDRSMFSACRLSAKYVFPPKNGPVPDWAVNAYRLSIGPICERRIRSNRRSPRCD